MMPMGFTRTRRRPSPPGGRRRERVGLQAPLVALLAMACTVEPRTDQNALPPAATGVAAHYREVVEPAGITRLPVFSAAIRNGDLLFLSGQIGAVPGADPPRVVEGGIEAETRQAFENIGTVLATAGLGPANLVKCTVFLADIADFDAMNSVYATFFSGAPPARSTVATSGLALGARVEVECIAAYPPGR
jgi:2-iminobutanoate/2-iminopropanoate deaminase